MSIILAYSGGLDTSVSIGWLKEKTGEDVFALAVDVGQGGESLEIIKQRALDCGAKDAAAIDCKDEFCDLVLSRALFANALYQKRYPLVSALSRPLIAKYLIKYARQFGAATVSHGCTGQGNDQVRFELAINSLAPDLKIIAPIRDLELTRDKAIEYAEKHNLPILQTKSSPYSVDANIWGRAIEAGYLEDIWNAPKEDIYQYTTQDNGKAEDIEITFKQGLPTAINGKNMSFYEIISNLNIVAGRHAIGRIDIVEDRLVGIKSREIYEAPAAITLIKAHEELENVTLEKELNFYKRDVENKWASMVYDGLWFSPLKKALDAFIASSQKHVEGTIKMRLLNGNATVIGRKSAKSLYDINLATYNEGGLFNHKAARGFIDIYSLNHITSAKRENLALADEVKKIKEVL